MSGATAGRRRPRAKRVAAFILLLLLLAAVVAGLVAFLSFRKDVHASNRRLPVSTKRVLAPSRDVLSEPQVILIVFDRASLVARTDPDARQIALLSIPSSARVSSPATGSQTVGDLYRAAGAAGVVRLARRTLDLRVAHVAVIRPRDIAPLVDAVGGVQIHDPVFVGALGGPGTASIHLTGAKALQYIEGAGAVGGDVRRERERALLEAVIIRLASAASFPKLPHLARTFSAAVATDLSPRETLALALVRLRSNQFVECALPEDAALEQPASRQVLRQFVGAPRLPNKEGRAFPVSGCRATALASGGVPRAITSFSEQALTLYAYVPPVAAAVIALDLILLLALLGVPGALVRTIGSMTPRRRAAAGGDGAPPKDVPDAEALGRTLAERVHEHTARGDDEPRSAPVAPTRPIQVAQARGGTAGGAAMAASTPAVESRPASLPQRPPKVERRAGVPAGRVVRLARRRRFPRLRARLLRYRMRLGSDAIWALGGIGAAVLAAYLLTRAF